MRSLELNLFSPYKAIEELWKHRKEWTSKNPEADFEKFVDSIGYYIQIHMVEQDSDEMNEARAVMDEIDPDDSEFVALALKLRSPIWTHDRHFLEQSRVEVVSSREILKRSSELPTLWEALKEEWFKQRFGRSR